MSPLRRIQFERAMDKQFHDAQPSIFDDFDTSICVEEIDTYRQDMERCQWMDQGGEDTAATPAPIGTLISECADGLDISSDNSEIPF